MTYRKRGTVSILVSLSTTFVCAVGFESGTANGMTIGAYAVASHYSCGAGNIPGTIRELDKFFASPSFPQTYSRNFYWKDARVRQSEWTKNGDYKSSTETTSGFDGADASLLTYIASHGVTTDGVYRALAGSTSNGGCYIPTTDLALGNNASRYTILSTCQGLKIGTGDNPAATGENPSRTWKHAANGLNCILGYSNNMADEDQYGEYLLQNMSAGNSSLAKAFFDASESVSVDNIPAIMCFGSSEQDAADYIENNSNFDPEIRSNRASAWAFRQISPNSSSQTLKASIPAVIKIRTKKLSPDRIAKAFLGDTTQKSSNNGELVFEASNGKLIYNTRTGFLSLSNNLIADIKSAAVPNANEALKIAENALQVSGLKTIAGEISLVATSEDVLGGESGITRVLARKFTFKQRLVGAYALSQQGSIDVTVGAGGVVTSIATSLVDIDTNLKSGLRPTELSSRMASIEDSAIQSAAQKSPGANYRVISQRIGYDTGNFHKLKSIAPAVVEVTVEASLGGFTRKFIEKIGL